MKSFSDKVRDIVRKIPKGKTMTYKEVAARAGNPKAARAVGAVMRTNYDPSIPCHRVIASDGSMGGYNRGGVAAGSRRSTKASPPTSGRGLHTSAARRKRRSEGRNLARR
jgi:methylated-DNA-[protein]-cysteine S-methyltransferase